MLTEAILAYARQQAETSGITMEVSETDAFPDTVNDTALTEKLEQLCIDHALPYTCLLYTSTVSAMWTEVFRKSGAVSMM